MHDAAAPTVPPLIGTAPPDPLLNTLVFLTRYHGQPFSAQALASGLPLRQGRLPLEQYRRAAERGGLSARVVRQPLTAVSDLLFPCVLLLADGGACVVLGLDRDSGQAEVVWPQTTDGCERVALDALQQQASGYLVYVRKRYRFDARAPRQLQHGEGHWFWQTLRLSAPIYRDSLLASVLINLFALASPLFVMNVYDRVVPNQAYDTLWVLAIGVTLVIAFDLVSRQMRGQLIDLAAKKSDVLLNARLFEKLLAMRMEARPPSVGGFARNIQDFDSIRDFITSACLTALVDLPFSLLFLLVIAIVGGPLALVPLVAIVVMVGHGWWIRRRLQHEIEEGARYGSLKNAHLVETLSGLESIKIAGAESQFQARWEELNGHLAAWNIRLRDLSSSVGNVSNALVQLTTVVLIVVGTYLIGDALVSMGALIAAVMLSGRALAPFSQIALLLTRYNQAEAALKALDQVMALPEERMDRYLHRPYVAGRVDFDKVSFAYPGSERAVLSELSLTLQPGEKVGIIGRIGAGKTSLEKLLLGLYTPQQGSIRVDGIDIQQISPADLRQKIGCLPQDIQLFYGSIRDNIALGVPHVEDERILRAAKLAGVSQFTDSDADGLDRQVGERGQYLSGGQRQAVALARALLFNPPILILDEPTSHMDNLAELQVREQLRALVADKTLLLITHKLPLLDLVDRVVVIERGRVVADGPRDQIVTALREGQIRGPR